MPIKPSKLPFTIGTDICNTSRFNKYIHPESSTKRLHPLLRLLDKVFTPPEQRLFWHKFRGLETIPQHRDVVAEYLGSRWAAKEAIIKAHSPFRALYMTDIEIHARKGRGPLALVLEAQRPRFGEGERAQAVQILEACVSEAGGSEGGFDVKATVDVKATLPVPDDTDGREVVCTLSHDGRIVVAVAAVARE